MCWRIGNIKSSEHSKSIIYITFSGLEVHRANLNGNQIMSGDRFFVVDLTRSIRYTSTERIMQYKSSNSSDTVYLCERNIFS